MAISIKQLRCRSCGGGDLTLLTEETRFSCYKCRHCKNLWIPTIAEIENDASWHRDVGEAFEAYREQAFAAARRKFKQLHKQKPKDPGVAWGLLQSEYGIKWVVDPYSGERKPTAYWAMEDDIFEHEAYRLAITECAEEQKANYERQAKQIAEIQKGICEETKKGAQYDVFISFKNEEEDRNIASRIYNVLTAHGYKVFFSPETMLNHTGTSSFEKIIFNALHTCKFFVLVSTQNDHISGKEARWVENECSRFEYRVSKEKMSNSWVAVLKNFDKSWNLPDIFKSSQNIFINSDNENCFEKYVLSAVNRRIKNISEYESFDKRLDEKLDEKLKLYKYKGSSASNTDSLYERGMLFLEDRDWKKAIEYFEKTLDANPYHALSYIGLMLSQKKLTKIGYLSRSNELLDHDSNFQKALRFADDDLKKKLLDLSNQVNERKYVAAVQSKNANTIPDLKKAISQFTEIAKYKDAMQQAQECQKNIFDKLEDSRCRTLKKQFDKVNEISEQVGGLEQISKTLFEHVSDFKKNDTKREYESQVCKMYSQKINDLISKGVFGNSLNLTCTLIQYEDFDVVDRNIDHLIQLKQAILACIERAADIRQVEIELPTEIDIADPNPASWKWCFSILDSINDLQKEEVFYGQNIIANPLSAFSSNTKYVLSEAECSYIENHEKKQLQTPLIAGEDARRKAKVYVEEHPNAIMTADSVRLAYSNYQRSEKLSNKILNPKLAKISFWVGFSVWIAMLLFGGLWMITAKPDIHGELVQAEYVNKVWPNIWRTLLILVGEIIVFELLGLLLSCNHYFPVFPKMVPTMVGLYLLYSFDISSIAEGYSLPFYIFGIGCVVLTFLFENEDILMFCKYGRWNKVHGSLRAKWISVHRGSIFYSNYIGLIPLGILFIYTKAFLILSVPAIWVITIPWMIAMVRYTINYFENL